MKILLGDFNIKVGEKYIFKLTTGNECLGQDSSDNGVRIVNFVTQKIYLPRSKCSRSETFISTAGPFLMGRIATRLIIY
jgi:hypothetical protein